jgi:hypothetical protein
VWAATISVAHAALRASSRVVTGDVVDSMKENDEEEIEDGNGTRSNSQP